MVVSKIRTETAKLFTRTCVHGVAWCASILLVPGRGRTGDHLKLCPRGADGRLIRWPTNNMENATEMEGYYHRDSQIQIQIIIIMQLNTAPAFAFISDSVFSIQYSVFSSSFSFSCKSRRRR